MTTIRFGYRSLLAGIFAALIALAGCGTNDTITTSDPGQGSTGDADFTRYVAIGNALTAGYQDGALTASFNDYSYPAIIARQAGVATFVQPEIEEPGLGSFSRQGGGKLVLTSLNPLILGPVPLTKPLAQLPTMLTNGSHPAPYNNLGIPGAFAVEIAGVPGQQTPSTSSATSMTANLFFDLVLRGAFSASLAGKSVLQQAALLQPTFATVWMGNDDVLTYALAGGPQPLLPTPVLSAAVSAAITEAVTKLQAAGADIAIANIPDINAIPYFTTVKPFYIVPATGQPWIENNAKLPLIGPDGELAETDLVLLSARLYVEAGVGVPTSVGGYGTPLDAKYILTASEQAAISSAIAAYNAAIQSIADAKGCALVDMYTFCNNAAKDGIYVGGVKLTTAMVTGGLFSLDGVHPNNTGYTLFANEFIKAINAKFNASIPLADASPTIASIVLAP